MLYALIGKTMLMKTMNQLLHLDANNHLLDANPVIESTKGTVIKSYLLRLLQLLQWYLDSLVHKYGIKNLNNGLAVRMSTLNRSSISSSYERSKITGFSFCK